MAGLAVATGPTIAACSSGPSYDEWATTDGAAGRINLDDVQNAFKQSKSPTDFEQRVNEIFEGDGILLISAKQDGERLVLEGWEDLNNNVQIDDAQDDLLFSLVKDNNEHSLRSLGKAGAKRWRGKRPTVRGVAMNPVDHPHGGGEGRTKGGRHPVSPTGKPAKGGSTRKRRKPSNSAIVRRRRSRRYGQLRLK